MTDTTVAVRPLTANMLAVMYHVIGVNSREFHMYNGLISVDHRYSSTVRGLVGRGLITVSTNRGYRGEYLVEVTEEGLEFAIANMA